MSALQKCPDELNTVKRGEVGTLDRKYLTSVEMLET